MIAALLSEDNRWINGQRIEVVLPTRIPVSVAETAREAVLQACAKTETCPDVVLRHEALLPRNDKKLRRVENCWNPGVS